MREAGTRQWRMCKTEAPHRKVVTPLSFFASWKEESRKEVNWRMEADRETQLLPRCMEVHCLQCKNCQYRLVLILSVTIIAN